MDRLLHGQEMRVYGDQAYKSQAHVIRAKAPKARDFTNRRCKWKHFIDRKTGGRTRGTPNKRTVEVAGRLDALGCDPIEGMALLAMDPFNSPELRGRMFAELAQYIAPKRKALEMTADPPEPVIFQLGFL